jgi:hypothetical protein
MRHYLKLNEYPQEFDDSLKPWRSICPVDTISQGTYFPHIKGKCSGNHYNVRTIFKTKYTLCGNLMKTRPVLYSQKTK